MRIVELPPNEQLSYELDLIEQATYRDIDGHITPDADFAISSLYGFHQPGAFQTIYRAVQHHQAAEDLSQDVMERVLLHSLPEKEQPRLAFPRGLGGFITRSAHNRAVDYFRRNSHSVSHIGDGDVQAYLEHLPDRKEPSVEQKVVDGSMALHDLLKMLVDSGMNRDFLTALLMTNEGYTCNEIAERQGVKRGTALTRIHRARTEVAKLISQNGAVETPSSANFGLKTQQG